MEKPLLQFEGVAECARYERDQNPKQRRKFKHYQLL